jgi:hypothetical protein
MRPSAFASFALGGVAIAVDELLLSALDCVGVGVGVDSGGADDMSADTGAPAEAVEADALLTLGVAGGNCSTMTDVADADESALAWRSLCARGCRRRSAKRSASAVRCCRGGAVTVTAQSHDTPVRPPTQQRRRTRRRRRLTAACSATVPASA